MEELVAIGNRSTSGQEEPGLDKNGCAHMCMSVAVFLKVMPFPRWDLDIEVSASSVAVHLANCVGLSPWCLDQWKAILRKLILTLIKNGAVCAQLYTYKGRQLRNRVRQNSLSHWYSITAGVLLRSWLRQGQVLITDY